ncbi:MAG: ADP-ribosylation factor family protein [Candidatus Thorarchaeota archaeon]
MSLLEKLFKKTKNINMTVCGLDKAGKTTIINYLVKGEYTDTIPTLGINREQIDFPKLRLNIFDLGGQIDFRGMWNQINEKSDALVYVIDSTDHFRINETKEVFYNIINTQIEPEIPVLILLNKVDLPQRISRAQFISEFELDNIYNVMKWACFETSALTGDGIYEAFHWFVNELREV